MRRPCWTTLLVASACLVAATPAVANFDSLYSYYATHGFINGCDHSPAELRDGIDQIPADVRQYDPGFEQALETALEQRLTGCVVTRQAPVTKGNTVTAADGSPGITPNHRSTPISTTVSRDVPGVVVVMIVLLGIVLLAGAVVGLSIYFGWNLEQAGGPVRDRVRRAGEQLSDRLYALRDRLGF